MHYESESGCFSRVGTQLRVVGRTYLLSWRKRVNALGQEAETFPRIRGLAAYRLEDAGGNGNGLYGPR